MYSIENISPSLTGDKLLEAMKDTKNKRNPIVEGFIYEQTVLMIAADPGCGKSTILAQMVMEMAAGLPVFGMLPVPKAVPVMVIQAERSIMELLERFVVLSRYLPLAKENIFVTDEYQKLNLLDPTHTDILIKGVKRDCPQVKVLLFDPLYALVAGGLKDDLPASAFVRSMSRVQKETGAALQYNHHTVKQQHSSNGSVIDKDDPFYGSQWLKAHITGSYYMKRKPKEEGHGVILKCKKDNYDILQEELRLTYDPETELCSLPIGDLPAIERIKHFVTKRALDGKEYSFDDILKETKLGTRVARDVLLHSSIKDLISVVSSSRNKYIYKSLSLQKS